MNEPGYVRQNDLYGYGRPWHRQAQRVAGQEPLDIPIACGGVLSNRIGTGTQSLNTKPTDGTFCPKCFPVSR